MKSGNELELQEHTVEAARQAAERVYSRPAQIRRVFMARPKGVEVDPPLVTMLRGGRGGQVRLKLYLSLLWLGVGAPHDVAAPARSLATLVGLRDPSGNGARRIRAAVDWLKEHRFVRVQGSMGQPLRITLLHESGSGAPYTVPGAAIAGAREKGQSGEQEDLYIQMAADWWTHGWIQILTGPGLAMVLVLLHAGRGVDREIWFSPTVAKSIYGLSTDTRTAGIKELERFGLVRVRRRVVRGRELDFSRLRNTYTMASSRLLRFPTDPLTDEDSTS